VTQEFELTLVGKPGCHLCDDAEVVVTAVLSEFAGKAKLTKINILEDEELFAQYSEQIPVLLIDGKVHNYWRIDPERLKSALNS
jgi:glutaredoxin